MIKPTVSVVIPTFNRSRYIVETLKSIANQTFKDFECLVIDDGSTDNTKEIVSEFCQKDSRFIYHLRPNTIPKGANSCRNHGVSQSQGIFVSFCDDDDFWISEKLKFQIDVFNKNTNIYVVTGDIEYVDEKGVSTNIIKSHWPKNHGYVFKNFLIKNRTSMVTPMLRREVIENVGQFNTNFVIAEDWEFWRRVSYCYEFYSLKEVLAYVRLHDGNISNTRKKSVFERFVLYKNLTKSLLKWGETRFDFNDKKLISYTEWLIYRRLFANNLKDFNSKVKFLMSVLINDYKDIFRLLKLFFMYNKDIRNKERK